MTHKSLYSEVLLIVSSTAVLFASLSTANAPAARQQAPNTRSVDSLAWIAGCWEQSTARSTTREHWSRPAGGAMMGVSFTVQKAATGDVASSYEFLRIHTKGGVAVYSALPSGQAATDFPLKTQDASSVTFENPTHDFPQRIIYRKQGTDSLVARVEGTRNGTPSGFNIAFKRTPCP